MMYRDIVTMCWSIREVNRNLSDRKSTVDYSIKYLKNACANLAGILKEVDKSVPNEAIEVIDGKGRRKTFSLKEVADMLYDARKIMELNLIDTIDRWARVHVEWEDTKSRPVG
jgi:hypothetical protein